jgi:hypothetical protein
MFLCIEEEEEEFQAKISPCEWIGRRDGARYRMTQHTRERKKKEEESRREKCARHFGKVCVYKLDCASIADTRIHHAL